MSEFLVNIVKPIKTPQINICSVKEGVVGRQEKAKLPSRVCSLLELLLYVANPS